MVHKVVENMNFEKSVVYTKEKVFESKSFEEFGKQKAEKEIKSFYLFRRICL